MLHHVSEYSIQYMYMVQYFVNDDEGQIHATFEDMTRGDDDDDNDIPLPITLRITSTITHTAVLSHVY